MQFGQPRGSHPIEPCVADRAGGAGRAPPYKKSRRAAAGNFTRPAVARPARDQPNRVIGDWAKEERRKPRHFRTNLGEPGGANVDDY